MRISERLYITLGIAAKAWQPGISHFGRAWFYWRPHLTWNKAWPFSDKVFSAGISWFCFFGSVDFWPTWVKKVNAESKRAGRQISA